MSFGVSGLCVDKATLRDMREQIPMAGYGFAQAQQRSSEPTSCQGKDILQGPTDLHPRHISGGIDPQVRAGKEALQLPGKILVLHMKSKLHLTTNE